MWTLRSAPARPVCPLCGSATLPRRRVFNGDPSFRCIRFPACRGTFDPADPPARQPAARARRSTIRLGMRAIVGLVVAVTVYLVGMNAGFELAQALTR